MPEIFGGLGVKFSIRDMAGTIANFRAYDGRLQREAKRTVRRNATRIVEIVRATVAYDTGRMQRLVRATYSPSGLGFEVGWFAEDFAAEEQPFYPPYVEVGTYIQAAQPSLIPAYFEVQSRLRDQLAGDMRRAVNRVR